MVTSAINNTPPNEKGDTEQQPASSKSSNSRSIMTSKQRDVLSFFVPSYEDSAVEIGTTRAQLQIAPLPANIGRLARGKLFSHFKHEHAEEAKAVYDYLLSLDNYDHLKARVKHLRTILNEGLYVYAISVTCLHHKETSEQILPPHHEICPTNYHPKQVISHAKGRRSKKVTDSQDPSVFTTGTVRDMEFKVAWWREDVLLNSHHHYWHTVFPHRGIGDPPKIKDRQGELFSYMHQQMLARYDAERLGVGLMRVQPFNNWNQPIKEGYNSHLTDLYGIQQYSARPANMYLADSWEDPEKPVLVRQQEYHYYRLLDAIGSGQFVKDTQTDQTHHEDQTCPVTIDSLGAAVESTLDSPNKTMYGSLHNDVHDLLANVSDPDHRYQTAMGVMGDPSTAIRDPIFFRWHKFVDNLFDSHKLKLDPYTTEDLKLHDLKIKSVHIHVEGEKGHHESAVLNTRMECVDVDISHDMFLDTDTDTIKHSDVNVKVRQLNQSEFKYKIQICAQKKMKVAFRIFIAPRFDELGNRYTLDSQRRLYIEMDKFVKDVNKEDDHIRRSSNKSSVIKPNELTSRQLKEGKNECNCRTDRYCGCGWPKHLLLPRGTSSGMQFDLFVMATDWHADRTTDLDTGTSYCGIKNKKYPDSRSMGFPFDRKIDINDRIQTIEDFADKYCNMFTMPIKIKYNES